MKRERALRMVVGSLLVTESVLLAFGALFWVVAGGLVAALAFGASGGGPAPARSAMWVALTLAAPLVGVAALIASAICVFLGRANLFVFVTMLLAIGVHIFLIARFFESFSMVHALFLLVNASAGAVTVREDVRWRLAA